MNEELEKRLKRSKSIVYLSVISLAIWLSTNIVLFLTGNAQQFGFIIVGSLAISLFWVALQQKIIKNTYKQMLDYKFDDLQKNVKKSSDHLLDNLTKESTELVNDFDFDITKLKGKKDSDLI